MFQELMPLLAQRTLVLTLCRISADEICVNVIPRSLQAGEKDGNTALFTPLALSGTPQELDQELSRQLVEFVAAHLHLASTLESVKNEMAAAAKAAKDAAKKVTTVKSGANPVAPDSARVACAKLESDSEGTQTSIPKTEVSSSSNGNLFDSAAEPASNEVLLNKETP